MERDFAVGAAWLAAQHEQKYGRARLPVTSIESSVTLSQSVAV